MGISVDHGAGQRPEDGQRHPEDIQQNEENSRLPRQEGRFQLNSCNWTEYVLLRD